MTMSMQNEFRPAVLQYRYQIAPVHETPAVTLGTRHGAMMQQNHAKHIPVCEISQQGIEALQLRLADAAGSHEGQRRFGTGQAYYGNRATATHYRKPAFMILRCFIPKIGQW